MVIDYNHQWLGNNRSGKGFTLLEVILAVTIAVGMMVVVFYFYQQTAQVRKNALEEMEKITAVRLVMDRLTTDLRTAINGSDVVPGLMGDSTSLEFIHLDAPVRESLISRSTGVTINIKTPKMRPTLKRTTYRLTSEGSTDGLYLLERIEKNFKFGSTAGNDSKKSTKSASTNEVSDLEEDDSFLVSEADETDSRAGSSNRNGNGNGSRSGSNSGTSSTNTTGTNSLRASSGTNSLSGTNITMEEGSSYVAMEGYIDDGTSNEVKIDLGNVLVQGIGYFALRYYDGSSWVDSWNKKELPLGVEITVGSEDPRTEEEKADEEAKKEEEEFQSEFADSEELDETVSADDGGLLELKSTLPKAADEDAEKGFTAMEGDSSESETNVVVFRRVIFLPNARTKSTASSFLSTLNNTNSMDLFPEEIF